MVLRLISCSPRRRIRLVTVVSGLRFCRTRSGRLASADLTPATGARTTRLCRTRKASVVCVPLIAHETPPCDTSHARRCRVHRIPPRVRDDRDTPLEWDETAGVLVLIWVCGEAEYFCKWGWTAKSP